MTGCVTCHHLVTTWLMHIIWCNSCSQFSEDSDPIKSQVAHLNRIRRGGARREGGVSQVHHTRLCSLSANGCNPYFRQWGQRLQQNLRMHLHLSTVQTVAAIVYVTWSRVVHVIVTWLRATPCSHIYNPAWLTLVEVEMQIIMSSNDASHHLGHTQTHRRKYTIHAGTPPVLVKSCHILTVGISCQALIHRSIQVHEH